jgi:hypothetical protein
MNGRPRLETILLALIAACVLFGGGLGCEPELDGTKFKIASYGDVRYAAFYGSGELGNGWARLPYPYVPTASISATVGVVNPSYAEESDDAEGCLFLEQFNTLTYFQLCVTYLLASTEILISSNLSGDTATCNATGALVRLVDTGGNVEAYYTCPGGMETQLESVSSQWNAGERWNMAFGGYNLRRGAEVGYVDLRYQSNGPFEASVEGNIAYDSFRAFSSGIEASKYFLAGNFGNGFVQALGSSSFSQNAFMAIDDTDLFPDSGVEKFLTKAYKSNFKLSQGLTPDRYSGYPKKFQKLAETLACAMEEEEPYFFD